MEDLTNSNLDVMRFIGLSRKNGVSDDFVLSPLGSYLTVAKARDELLEEINPQANYVSCSYIKI